MNTVKEKIKKYLIENNLLDKTVILAFSGGFDSLCLLDVLHSLKIKVIAAHLNHNWRGDESLNDEKFCASYCKKKGIPFYTATISEKVAKTETAAREARYEFLQNVAKKFNANYIFTAHNADDNAETVLYRIIKGTGIYGLEGIKSQRGIFYRPMLDICRCEIEEYCQQNNLSARHDSSNDDTKYKRNLIRHKIIPLLEEINRDAKKSINSLSEIAQGENEIIEQLLPDITNIKTSLFSKYSIPLQNRIIHKLLKEKNIDYDREKIENIRKFILNNQNSKSGIKMSLADNLWLFVNSKKISLISELTMHKNTEIEIKTEGHFNIDEKIEFVIEKHTQRPEKYPPDQDKIAFVDLSNVTFPLILRNRKDGDIIRPLGCSGKRKLKKYLNDKKIPNHEKNNLLFLCQGNEILWAIGNGISEKIKVKGNPTHRLLLIKKENVNEYSGC